MCKGRPAAGVVTGELSTGDDQGSNWLQFERNFCLAPWVRATFYTTKFSRNLGEKKRNYETKFGGLLRETLISGEPYLLCVCMYTAMLQSMHGSTESF